MQCVIVVVIIFFFFSFWIYGLYNITNICGGILNDIMSLLDIILFYISSIYIFIYNIIHTVLCAYQNDFFVVSVLEDIHICYVSVYFLVYLIFV